MKLLVKVKPNAKKELVEKVGEPALNTRGTKVLYDFYRVWVKEPAVDGKANEAVAKALADYLKLPQELVKIRSGQASKQKIFEILKPKI